MNTLHNDFLGKSIDKNPLYLYMALVKNIWENYNGFLKLEQPLHYHYESPFFLDKPWPISLATCTTCTTLKIIQMIVNFPWTPISTGNS